jgi:hypothetical protein
MSAKQIWGMILIGLSLAFILSGAYHYHELTSVDAMLQASLDSLGKMKTWIWSPKEAKVYASVVRNEKIISVVGFLLEICMAVIGTMMLKDQHRRHYQVTVNFNPGIDALDDENTNSGRFKF